MNLRILLATTLIVGGCSGRAADVPAPTPTLAPTLTQGAPLGPRHVEGKVVALSSLGRADQALAPETPVTRALVYLIRQDDTFLSASGSVVVAQTDASGSFIFPDVPDEPLLVAAVLPGNKRLTGLVKPALGPNELEVGVASTYVAAYLRNRAFLAGRKLESYPLPALKVLITLTQDQIAAGNLPLDPDISVDATPRLARLYGVVAASRNKDLADGWNALLGKPTPAVETLAVPRLPGGAARTVTVSASGDVYFGEFGENAAGLWRARPGALIVELARGRRFDPESFGLPTGLTFGSSGKLLYSDALRGLIRQADPKNFPGPNPDAVSPMVFFGPASESPAFPSESFNQAHPAAKSVAPWGLATDPGGTIYAADWQNHRILAIDGSGQAKRIAGKAPDSTFDSDALAGFGGDGGPATEASLASPNGLTWRAEGTKGALYVADADNHRIRRIDLDSGIITTVAGSGPGFVPGTHDKGAFLGDGGAATSARLSFPTKAAFLPDGTLVVADSGNQRIRSIGTDGVIRTLAGVDPAAAAVSAQDGPADEALLGEVLDLAVDGSDVVFAARDRGVRKLWLRFGH